MGEIYAKRDRNITENIPLSLPGGMFSACDLRWDHGQFIVVQVPFTISDPFDGASFLTRPYVSRVVHDSVLSTSKRELDGTEVHNCTYGHPKGGLACQCFSCEV